MTIDSIGMTTTEIDEFLVETRHAVMGTIRANGSPQISPVWYLYRDSKFYVGIYSNSAKCLNLSRDHRVSLCVDGVHPDARYVAVYGTAEIVSEQSAWRDEIERVIAYRYHNTSEEAEDYLRVTSGPDAVLLIITPQKMLSQNYN